MTGSNEQRWPDGWGIGLRPQHYPDLHGRSHLPILEILADNYLYHKGGPSHWHAKQLAERTNVVMHSVGLNIAGLDPLNKDYLVRLKDLARQFEPKVISDHLCFTGWEKIQSYDLLPFPYTFKNLHRLTARVDEVQATLGECISLENLTAYVSFEANDMSEIEFLVELCKRSGCRMLLDVNNLYASSFNLNFDPYLDLHKINPDFVSQFHISGYSVHETYLHDTHDQKVSEEVWNLLANAIQIIGDRPIILERDDDAVTLDDLYKELCFGEQFLLRGRTSRSDSISASGRDFPVHTG